MEVICIGAQGTPTTLGGVENDRKRALGHLEKVIQESPGSIYKVGISTNPTTRSYGHHQCVVDRREEGDMIYLTIQTGLWNRMFVIFQSPLEDVVRQAEIDFIDHAQKVFADFHKHGVVSMNTSAGGGGPLGRQGPYYVYVLRSAA